MKKKLNWQINLEKGNFYLKHFKYYSAKEEFSKIINYKQTPKAWKIQARFLVHITNFHIKRYNYWRDYYYNLYSDFEVSEFSTFQKSFLYAILVTKEKSRWENVINRIQNDLNSDPEIVEKYKNLLIHLPLDFQIIFKMTFY